MRHVTSETPREWRDQNWRAVLLRFRLAVAVLTVAWLLVAAPRPAIAAQEQANLAEMTARGREAMQARRYDDAVAVYSELVRKLPDEPRMRFNLGIALHSAGRYEAAAAELERVVASDPSLAPAWLMLGVTRLKLGQPDRAVLPLGRAVEKEPENTLARIELADTHLQLGHFRDAASHFDKAAGLDPKSPKAWLGVGRSYTGIARQTFEELERLAPDSGYWAALVARAKASQQQYRTAFQLYRQAAERTPTLRGVHSALAEIYRRTDHPEWAGEEDRREQLLPSLNCPAEQLACEFAAGAYRGLVDRLAGATTAEELYWRSLAASELAREAFARLDAMPPSAEIHGLRAEAFRIRGLHQLAIQELQSALKLSPEDRELRHRLAEAYWLNGDFERALPLFQSLHREMADSAAIAYQLGDTLLQLQKPDEAIPLLTNALERRANYPEAQVALARALVRVGRWQEAIPHLEATRERDEDGGLHVLLARAYAATGQNDRSGEMMQRAEELRAAAAAHRQVANESSEITAP
jgi:tetratricopeptide (TPR) repeat protein